MGYYAGAFAEVVSVCPHNMLLFLKKLLDDGAASAQNVYQYFPIARMHGLVGVHRLRPGLSV